MVKEVVGDLLTCDADIICHQVNTYGVMGGGIAAAIRRKLLTQEQYAEYQRFCNDRRILGKVQFIGNCIRKDGSSVILANIFSQEDMTTDYVAFDMCMGIVRDYAMRYGYTVAVPGHIGCGIAGGNWDTVKGILYSKFQDPYDPSLTIVNWDKEV